MMTVGGGEERGVKVRFRILGETGRERETGRLDGALSAFELQYGHTDGQEQRDPRDGGHEAQVHVGFEQVPAAGQYAPQ